MNVFGREAFCERRLFASEDVFRGFYVFGGVDGTFFRVVGMNLIDRATVLTGSLNDVASRRLVTQRRINVTIEARGRLTRLLLDSYEDLTAVKCPRSRD